MAMRRTIFEPEHETFRDNARRFFQQEIGPHGERWREAGVVDRDAYLKAGEQGYLMMWADETYGGAGVQDFRYEQVLIEENIRHGESSFYLNLHSRLVGPYIGQLGNDEQKERFLPPCIRGEKILAVAITEPAAGSDVAGLKTHAEDGGDHWLLNGSKTYISNGQLADVVVVVARTVPEQRYGLGLFLVERGMEGFETANYKRKLSLRASVTSELFFKDVFVPEASALPDVTGLRGPLSCLNQARYGIAWGAMGAAQHCFEAALRYSLERQQFGRPIASFQLQQRRLSEMATALVKGRLVAWRLGQLKQEGRATPAQISLAKRDNVYQAREIARAARELLGAMGIMLESHVMRHSANLESVYTYEGTHDVHHLILGEALTGIAAFE